MKKLLLHVGEVLLDSVIGAMGAAVIFTDVDWRVVASTAALSGTIGFLFALKRLLEDKNRKLAEEKAKQREEKAWEK